MNSKDKLLATWSNSENLLNASRLKILACIFMLISHIGQTNFIYLIGYPDYAYPFMIIGRIAFPIFCFFIVQGFILTSNIGRYFLRLFIFALISEIPFDLAFSGGINIYSQNVFFTLFLGGLCIYLLSLIEKSSNRKLLKLFLYVLVLSFFMFLAKLLKTDYSYKGIVAIFLLYIGRNSKLFTSLSILVGFYFEAYLYGVVYLSIVLILLYNGKKGTMNKWLFYLFYPGHLLILYILMNYFNY